MSEKFNWTPAAVRTLTEKWTEGMSGTQIAEMLGVSRSAVLGKLNRLNLLGTRSAEVTGFNRTYADPLKKRQLVKRMTHPAKPVRPIRKPNNLVAVNAARRAAEQPVALPALKSVPVDASLAKPWTERKFGECAFPVSGSGADTMSCCQPTSETYCPAHRKLMTNDNHTFASVKSLMRLARRVA